MNFYRTKINRQKLNKTFWWIIAHSEIDKDEAYRVVESVTGKQHLHEISNYEFKRVVDERLVGQLRREGIGAMSQDWDTPPTFARPTEFDLLPASTQCGGDTAWH